MEGRLEPPVKIAASSWLPQLTHGKHKTKNKCVQKGENKVNIASNDAVAESKNP